MNIRSSHSFLAALLFVLLLSVPAMGQVSIFTCDFEDDAQNAQWVLSSGSLASSIPHKWVIDTAANNTFNGNKGMYVSTDEGVTASYVSTSSYVIAYIDLQLAEGKYDFSFDWRAGGNTLTAVDGLMVGWAEEKDFLGRPVQLNSNTNSTIDQLVNTYLLNLDNPDKPSEKTKLRGKSQWQTKITTLESDGTPHRLFFLWVNSNASAVNPPACVDNITILPQGACPSPTDVYIATDEEMNLVTVSWTGSASLYEVRAYSYASERWITRQVADTFIVFNSISEGMCDFHIRAICDDIKSVPYSRSEFVYYPANHCIDYITLTDQNCSYTTGFKQTTDVESPSWMWTQGRLNEGDNSIGGQHTLMTEPDTRDPYTGGKLLKVAPNELASVRLGTENSPHLRASRATFQYKVDAQRTPVLMMKYAVVLQEPGHDIGKPGSHVDPRFTLRVMDRLGRSIGSCAEADFTSSSVDESAGWQGYQPSPEEGLGSTKIVWKDWTPVGVNLSNYDGQTLTVQLTAIDCGASGHFGYAYFTLGCSNGQLSGMSCGMENTEFVAPDGFVYRWYKASDEQRVHNIFLPFDESLILSRDRVFTLTDPNDTTRYAVDMMFVGDTTCNFTLYASSLPYFPVADMTYDYKPTECRNIFQFYNTSHIKEYNKVTQTEVHTDKKVDYVEWDFGDGTTSMLTNPEHEYPAEGGLYTVTVKAYVGECDPDERQFFVIVPKVGALTDTLKIQACKSDGYHYVDTVNKIDTIFTESTVFTDSLVSSLGCDSITVLDITILDTIYTTIDTMIMNNETYHFNGKDLNTQGTYVAKLKSTAGCDSIVTLNLFIHDVLKVAIDTLFTICGDDGVLDMPYEFISGFSPEFSLRFATDKIPDVENQATTLHELHVDMPTSIEPNEYEMTLHFFDSIGGNLDLPLRLVVNYPSSVIAQRWNDVLAVRNEEFNGGYTFSSYQWYKNMSPIEGATGSYLYVAEGLDKTASYTALVTRSTDGVSLFICPVIPEAFDETQNIPTLVAKGSQMSLEDVVSAEWYTTLGELLLSARADNGIASLTVPSVAGVYLLRLTFEDGTEKRMRVVVH